MSKPITLDYDARVPMEERAPISINDKPVKDLPTFQDYIPSHAKLKQMASDVKVKRQNPHEAAIGGSDFVPSELTKAVKDKRREEIKAKAKALYESEAAFREHYLKAKKVVDKLTAQETQSPNEENRQYMSVIKGRSPLTPEQCVMKVKEQLNEEYKFDSLEGILAYNKAR